MKILEMKATQPSYRDAMQAGIEMMPSNDMKYMNYHGVVEIVTASGETWKCEGIPARGRLVSYIRFTKVVD